MVSSAVVVASAVGIRHVGAPLQDFHHIFILCLPVKDKRAHEVWGSQSGKTVIHGNTFNVDLQAGILLYMLFTMFSYRI